MNRSGASVRCQSSSTQMMAATAHVLRMGEPTHRLRPPSLCASPWGVASAGRRREADQPLLRACSTAVPCSARRTCAPRDVFSYGRGPGPVAQPYMCPAVRPAVRPAVPHAQPPQAPPPRTYTHADAHQPLSPQPFTTHAPTPLFTGRQLRQRSRMPPLPRACAYTHRPTRPAGSRWRS